MSDDLKESNASYEGGTNGAVADTSKSDLRRGYSNAKAGEEEPRFGDESGGFAGRAKGWER